MDDAFEVSSAPKRVREEQQSFPLPVFLIVRRHLGLRSLGMQSGVSSSVGSVGIGAQL